MVKTIVFLTVVLCIANAQFSYQQGTVRNNGVSQGQFRGYIDSNKKLDGYGHMFFNDNTPLNGMGHFSGTYKGQYVHGNREGHGIFRKNNGQIYAGEVDGVPNGYGMLLTDQFYYIGYWRQGRAHGDGLLVYKNGTHLSGLFDGTQMIWGNNFYIQPNQYDNIQESNQIQQRFRN